VSAVRHALVLLVALAVCGTAGAGAFPGGDGLIVFSRDSGGPQPELVALDPATGAQHALGAGVEPAWSPDGKRLAFVKDATVYLAAADGSGAQPLGAGEDPAWSPDGTRLAVVRSDGAHRQVALLGLPDGSATLLTDGSTDARLPAWSPDGATIAFARGTGLETVPATGGDATPLPLGSVAVAGGPSWSPDGARLAFVDAHGQVWTAAADGAGARQLTYTLGPSTDAPARPAWSPDGATIAFASGADLCVTDLGGAVRRLTRTPQSTPAAVASLPDWQPAAGGSGMTAAPPATPTDSPSCDSSPGVRVEILPVNVSPSIVAVPAPQELVFVNHLDRPVTLTTSAQKGSTVIEGGRFFGFPTAPGEYDFVVTGYPDGMPRRGSVVVVAAGSVSIDQHAAIRYGASTVLEGAADGVANEPVTVTAQAYGSRTPSKVATVKPVAGRWQVTVAPRISTVYRVSYGGATSMRLLRVMPALRVRRTGHTATAALAPARQLAGRTIYVFRSRGRAWSEYRHARVGRTGTTAFRNLPPGRFYVAFAGGDAYWATASEPFTVRR